MSASLWSFYWAVANPSTTPWPPENLPEIAFVGRSNVGKSSLINTLMRRKSLARTSKNPGQTQQINFYHCHNFLMLADLPGYGYAKVSHTLKDRWQHLIKRYLEERQALSHVYVLIDSRRGIGPQDTLALQMLNALNRSYSLICTKLDKLSESQKRDLPHNLSKSYTEALGSLPFPPMYTWSLLHSSSHHALIKDMQRHATRSKDN